MKSLSLILSTVEFLWAAKSSLHQSELLHQVLREENGPQPFSEVGELHVVISPATFGFPAWESFFAHAQHTHQGLAALPSLPGCASTSSVPVTQHKCNAVLCKPQGFPLRCKEGDGVPKPSEQAAAALAFTLVWL